MITNFNDWQNAIQNRNEPKEEIKNPLKDRADANRAKAQERIEKLKTKPDVSNFAASRMLELRRAVQMFLSTLDADTQTAAMMEVASVFPQYEVGKAYKAKDVFSFGENGVGDPQLYQVLQAHTSAAKWTPDATPSLYKAIGVTEDGYPEWVQPIGASDAYNTGDMVSYNGTVYRSLIDGNTWAPDAYPAGWENVTE